MGKAQSKRSVDITTDVKKDDVEEGTGKMEKIEDLDQLKPQINGDTHHTDNEATEKAGEESTENEKDLSTEKEQKPQIEGGGDDSGVVASGENKAIENGDDETLNESKTTDTSTAESGDNSKKKKEKVKKKWSLRSISFGKKDKQKPPKKEEVVNGECEKVPEETTEDPAAASKDSAKDEEKSEATPAATTTPVEDKSAPALQGETSNLEEKVDPTAPVTNGNEPTKDKTSETTAESNKTDVVEPPVSKGTEESTKEAAKPDDAPKECVTESPAATKIEVKDDVKTEIAVDKPTTKESGKGDGDSEIAQSPPPPLPSIPPPSQVMVFALSDTEKPSETEQSQIPPSVIEQPVEKSSESVKAVNESAENASSVHEAVKVAEQIPPAEGVQLSTEEQKKEESGVAVQKTAEVSKESQVLKGVGDGEKQAVESTEEKKDPNISEENKEKGTDVASSESSKDVPQVEEEKKVIDQLIGKNVKLEGDINPEQIAQTIALIDEVTQEAAAITKQKLESHTEPAVVEKTNISQEEIQPKSESTEKETSCKAPLPEEKSISPPTASEVPENSSIIDTQIPPVEAPKFVEETKVENIKEEGKPVESQTESHEKISEQGEQKADVSAQAKADTDAKVALEVTNKIESADKSETTPEGVKLETHPEPAHTPQSKENGVGDHPAVVESAAVSSDSQPESKTAEVVEIVTPQVDTTTNVSSDSGAAQGGSDGGNDGGNIGGERGDGGAD